MSPAPRAVLLLRHGETDWNKAERFQGHIDIDLNDTGRAQARALVPTIRAFGAQALLCSDLSRARETARIIASAAAAPGEPALAVHEAPGLREAHLGEAQGLTRAEIEARFGDMAKRWRSWHVSDADVFYPGGESGAAVTARAFQALEAFLDREAAIERIAVITHGGVIRRLMSRLLPPGSEPVPIPNGVSYELLFDPLSREWRRG